jgi:hypothetical protein
MAKKTFELIATLVSVVYVIDASIDKLKFNEEDSYAKNL